jgi:formylglycine-generating enzyme required for sulfatase activity
MKTTTSAAGLLIAASLFSSIACASVTMDWVTVGNAGNAPDPLTGFGAVDYEYKIGKYEVTNAQYGAFLNAKGQSNSNGIYNSSMSSYGITQSGSSGSYTYSVTGTLANRPVVYVSWFDAARFANWMMNGQGSGDTETGAYTLNGATNGIIYKNAGEQIGIPTEDEWYKAAYYNAVSQTYSLYPNGQNTITNADANYGPGGSSDVGSYTEDPSFYGTFDQGGNVWEFNDADMSNSWGHGSARGIRGCAYNVYYWSHDSYYLRSEFRTMEGVESSHANVGFRLALSAAPAAPAVPEPSSMLLTILTGGVMLIRRKR